MGVGSDLSQWRKMVELPPVRTSPREARLFVDVVLHQWGRDGAIDKVALIASELVTNAVVHAKTEIWLALEALDDVVRLEVGDRADEPPAIGYRSPPEPHGLGLPIVEALASSWGATQAEAGKYVWAEVRG